MNTSNVREIALIGAEGSNIDALLWIGDTGATSHMVSSDFGMFDAESTRWLEPKIGEKWKTTSEFPRQRS